MDSKHTPGPWWLDPHESTARGDKVLSVCDETGERTIAVVHGPSRAADARLIAAAPELLAACKMAMTWMRHAGKECRELEDAIAKTTGETR